MFKSSATTLIELLPRVKTFSSACCRNDSVYSLLSFIFLSSNVQQLNIRGDKYPDTGGFTGPEAVLAYLSRYTHRVAIANSRLIACDERGVTFKWKDYRTKHRDRYKTMTLTTDEFIRRFLIHVLPSGFHRIRHYGLFANHTRVKYVQRLRELLNDNTLDDVPETNVVDDNLPTTTYICPACGAPMMIIETFEKQMPRAPPVYL
jgi:hypothetical protein